MKVKKENSLRRRMLHLPRTHHGERETYVEATYENKRCHLGCMETEPIESVLSFFGVPLCVTNSDGKEVHIYG